jgi:uncharacterized protein YciI
MPEFIYLIRPQRPEFFKQSTPQEDTAMDAHFAYLKQATADGLVILAGPCLDETFGIVVLSAESESSARAFMLNDPAVNSEVMTAELHAMKVSLTRC